MKTLVAILCLSVMPLLAACNTMEGMGEDISKGGDKIEKEANQNKGY